MEAHSANILRKSGRGASREGIFYVRAAAHPERGVYVRAGAGRWERRGPAGSSCSGGAGIEPPCPDGAGRIPVRSACSGMELLFRRGRHGAAAVSGRVPVASPCGVPVPAWTLCSGGGPAWSRRRLRMGPVASPGRKASHLRAQRPPEGARCSVFGHFLSFSAASRRAGTDAVCKSAVSPLGKSEKVVFLFLLYN